MGRASSSPGHLRVGIPAFQQYFLVCVLHSVSLHLHDTCDAWMEEGDSNPWHSNWAHQESRNLWILDFPNSWLYLHVLPSVVHAHCARCWRAAGHQPRSHRLRNYSCMVLPNIMARSSV